MTNIKELKKNIKTAIISGEEERVIELTSILAIEANINDNLFGLTNTLMLSAQRGLNKVVNNLIENYKDTLDLNQGSIYGSALFLAIDGEQSEVVDSLIAGGVDVNIINAKGATALGIAERYGNQKIIHSLKASNAQSIIPTAYAEEISDPKNQLRRAIEQKRQEDAIDLIDKMSIEQLNSKIAAKSTPLLFAAYHNCLDVVIALKNKGVDTTARNKFGDAITIAQDNGYHDIVKELQVNVNAFGEVTSLVQPFIFPTQNSHMDNLITNNIPDINQRMIDTGNLRGHRSEQISSINTTGPYGDFAKGALGVAALGIVGYKAIKGVSNYLFGKSDTKEKSHTE